MKFQIHLTANFPISPEKLYNAWLSSDEHTNFTGGKAVIDPNLNGRFTAWDDYISGVNIELQPHSRILQEWRTSEFKATDSSSKLELLFEATDEGCRLTLNQWDVPEDQVSSYSSGWIEHYFEPMAEYF